MKNYFNQLPLREQLAQLGKCRFMEASEFEDGIKALEGKKVVIVGCGAQGLNQGSITLTNANPKKAIAVNLQVGKDFKSAAGKIITAKEITDYNDFDKAEKVFISDFKIGKIKNGTLEIEVPAHSVILVQAQ